MGNTFIAIDVETANSSRATICQIGLTAIEDEQVSWQWSSLVDPQEEFEKLNCDIHGIQPGAVFGASSFPAILAGIANSLSGHYIVSWSEFDQDAVHQASEKYGVSPPECYWIDSCRIARAIWPKLENHKLATVAELLGIQFEHHDAAADAWACAQITIAALRQSATNLEYWYNRNGRRTPRSYEGAAHVRYPVAVSMDGDPNGPLFGHTAVFTGDFTQGKGQLGAAASRLGCCVRQSITKKTTMVVYGPGPNGKTRKLLEAEQLLADGRQVTFLDEQQFIALANSYNVSN